MVRVHTPCLVLLHRHALGAFAREEHLFGVGIAETERDRPVGVDLGR